MLRMLVLAVALVMAAAPLRAEEAGDPRAVVEGFYARLLEVWKGSAPVQARAEALTPAVDKAFGLAAMTKTAVGPFARQYSAEQMTALTDAFRRWTVANYAAEFTGWHGERFELGDARPSEGEAMLVPSQIVESSGKRTELDYLLRRIDGQWRITDVLAEGSVSQLAVRRSEFVSVLRREGYDGLMRVLQTRTAALTGS